MDRRAKPRDSIYDSTLMAAGATAKADPAPKAGRSNAWQVTSASFKAALDQERSWDPNRVMPDRPRQVPEPRPRAAAPAAGPASREAATATSDSFLDAFQPGRSGYP